MDDDNNRPPETGKRRHRRSFGAGFALVGLLVIVGLLAAACEGGSKDPGAASGSGTNTTVAPGGKTGAAGSSGSSTIQTELLQLAQCMRSHGVPTFPDPSAKEGTLGAMVSAAGAAGIDLQSPTVQAALEACKQYTPTQNLTPAQSAAQNAQELQFAQCMRSHGVPNFPDPSTGTGTGTGAVHLNLGGTGIDMSSPTFQATAQACGGLKQ
jgi:acyl-CoA synthetase (NDP forming)